MTSALRPGQSACRQVAVVTRNPGGARGEGPEVPRPSASPERDAPRGGGSSGRRGREGDRPVGRARRIAERRFKQRRRQRWGRGGGGRPGAAPRGAKVQTGGDGGGGDRPVGRVRRLAERRSRRAATAAVGAWPGAPAGRELHEVRVQAGGEGGGGHRPVGRVRQSGWGRSGWAGVAGSPFPRCLGRRGRLPGNHRTSLTWVNTEGDGRVGRPAHRESTPGIPGRASRPGSAPGRPESP